MIYLIRAALMVISIATIQPVLGATIQHAANAAPATPALLQAAR